MRLRTAASRSCSSCRPRLRSRTHRPRLAIGPCVAACSCLALFLCLQLQLEPVRASGSGDDIDAPSPGAGRGAAGAAAADAAATASAVTAGAERAHARHARPFVARDPHGAHARARRGAPGWGARGRRDERTGHVHYDHEEFRINREGKRTHYRFRGVQVAEVVHLDELESPRVRGVDCGRAPTALSVLLDEAPLGRTGPFRPGVIVVGSEHWRCAAPPRDGPGGRGATSGADALVGLMVRVRAVRAAPCSAELRGDGPETKLHRGVCLEMDTEQAALTDVFSDLELLLDDEALSHPFEAGVRVPEEVFRSPLGLPGFHPLHHSALPSALDSKPHPQRHERGEAEAQQGRRRLHFFKKYFRKVTGGIAKGVSKVVNPIVRPVAKAVVTCANKVKKGVNVVTKTVKKTVNVAVQGAVKGVDGLNRITGDRLSIVTGPVKQTLNAVDSTVAHAMDTVDRAANTVTKVVSAAAEGVACLTGGCDPEYDETLANFDFNYDVDKRQQRERLKPFDYKMDVKTYNKTAVKAKIDKAVVNFDPEFCYYYAKAGVRVSIRFREYKLEKFELMVYVEADARIKGVLLLQIQASIEVLKSIYAKEFKKKIAAAGPVVFTFSPTLDVKLGFSGEVALNFAQVLEGQVTLAFEAGIVRENGRFTPTARWRDNKKPVIKIPRPNFDGFNYSIAMSLLLSPQLDVTAGVYGIQFMTSHVGVKLKIGFIRTSAGPACHVPNLGISLGILPFLGINFELSTLLKKQPLDVDKDLSLKLFNRDFKISPFDNFDIFRTRCVEAKATDGTKPTWVIQTAKRATDAIKLSWDYAATSLIAEDIAIFRVQWRKKGATEFSSAYVPITSKTSPISSQRIATALRTPNVVVAITPSACPASLGYMMVADAAKQRGHCRRPDGWDDESEEERPKISGAEVYAVSISASDLNSAFSHELDNLEADTEYEVIVSGQRVDGSQLFPGTKTLALGLKRRGLADASGDVISISTLAAPPPAPRNARFVESKTDTKAAGKYAVTIAWDAPDGTAPIAFYQVLVSPRRVFTSTTTPCTASRHRDPGSAPGAACLADAPSTVGTGPTGVGALMSPTAASVQYFDYVPTFSAGDRRVTIDGLEPGLVYVFKVQSMVPVGSKYRGSKFAPGVAVQTPGFPPREALQPSTQLPLEMNVVPLACRTFRVTWSLNRPTYGGSLIKSVIIFVSNGANCGCLGSEQFLLRDVGALEANVTLPEPSEEAAARNITYTFSLWAQTEAGSRGEGASNVISAIEEPCVSASPPGRRRHLHAAEKMLNEPPAAPEPDPNFVTTVNDIDISLAVAANASAAPEDPTALVADGAGAYDNLYAANLDAVYAALDNASRSMLEDLRASREQAVFDFAALPDGGSLNQTVNSSISIDTSTSVCPPDFKLPASLGRNALASLCPYELSGSTQVCETAASYAVQFLFSATRAGLYRFSTAGGRPALLDVRSNGTCSPFACTAPLSGGSSELWLFLAEGTSLAINAAPAGGGCSGTVVLEISVEQPYGERVHVDTALGSDEAPLATFGEEAPAAGVRRYATLDAALAYAYNRTVAAAGAALQIGVFLQPGTYSRNASSNAAWSTAAPASASAAGARIFIRSLSGAREGPNSAADTILTCSGLGPAFTLAHTSPLLVPLGVGITLCGAAQNYSKTDSNLGSAGAALTYRGLQGVELRNVAFLLNSNAAVTTAGVGGAVALVGGASARFVNCVFVKNGARASGGAVAVLDGSDAAFDSCVFVENAAPVGGAVVVGSEAAAAGAVSLEGCTFRGNAARSADPEDPQPAAFRGGALAAIKAASRVLVNGSSFSSNAADAGAALWIASEARVSNSDVSGSDGSGIWVQDAAVSLEAVVLDGNESPSVAEAGGGLTCAGPRASLSASGVSFTNNAAFYGGGALLRAGCTASFSLCEFASNFALVGGGACVGLWDEPAGPVRFAEAKFATNNAGVDEDVDGSQEDGAHVGLGGGLAALAASSPIAVSRSVFAENVAYMGAGLYAAAPVEVGGGSAFTRNAAGFPWLDAGSEDAAAQIGGGALLAVESEEASVVADVTFFENEARGAYGGGLAVESGLVRLNGTRLLSNAALAPLSQGAGLYFERQASLAPGSTFFATANRAAGPFDNVLFADQVPTAGGDLGQRAFKNCGTCSLCQVCDTSLGRCVFPPDLGSWCDYIGGCNASACPYVSVGGAAFGDGFGTLSLDFDVDVGLSPAGVAGPATANGTLPVDCGRIFVANTTAALGLGAACALRVRSGARRALLAATGVAVTLGSGFAVQPGTDLAVQPALLSALVRGMSDAAVIEVAQASVPAAAVQASLQEARAAASARSSSFVPSYQSASAGSSSGSSSLGVGAVVAISVGASAAVLLAALGVWLGTAKRMRARAMSAGGRRRPVEVNAAPAPNEGQVMWGLQV